jgi:hypothetical protein
MQELLTRYEYLSQQYQALVSQNRHGVEGESVWQTERSLYERMVKQLQRAIVSLPTLITT